jgi:hypothetical protein
MGKTLNKRVKSPANPTPPKVPCKWCGRIKCVVNTDGYSWWCSWCNKLFDQEPDENGAEGP